MSKTKKILLIIIASLLMILALLSILLNIYYNNKIHSLKIQDENVVFFGDSITAGYNVKEFFDQYKVVNSGVGGDITEDLINRIDIDLYDYNPSKVFILIGINDINHNKSDNEILNNIKIIIKDIKQNRKNANIYIESIYPVNRTIDPNYGMIQNQEVNNKRVQELNKKIKKLCNIENITYINVFDSLIDKDGNLKQAYTKEGIHLTDLGYHKVTEVIKKYLEN